jgi:GLPGLI family protein
MFVKHLNILTAFFLFFMSSCSSNKQEIKEGTIIYSAEYPNHKKNLFLYSILPKEMEISFLDGVVRNDISRANLQNIWLFDCNKKQMDVYFQYGEEAYKAKLSPNEMKQMLNDQEKYQVELVDGTDTLAGFNAKKAIARNKKNKLDVITLWYTEEIALENPNWYNTFDKVPGVLLAYSVDRYGIRMDYRAVKFIPKIDESKKRSFTLPAKGTAISYKEYDKKMNDLFATFE